MNLHVTGNLRRLFIFAGICLASLHVATAHADYPLATLTYAAPWISYDGNSNGIYTCIDNNEGGAEACMTSYWEGIYPYQQSEGWQFSGDPVGCQPYDLHPTACPSTSFGNTPAAGDITAIVGQRCIYGGSWIAGGLDFPGYCLLPAQINYNPGCPYCNLTLLGNPIDSASGNKYETVTDYRGGGAFPLVFSRAYNSGLTGVTVENMGNAWSTNLGEHLSIASRGQLVLCQDPESLRYYGCPGIGYSVGTSPIEVTVWGADGSQSVFTYQYSTASDGTQLTTEQTMAGQLFFVAALPSPAIGSGFRYLRNDGYTEYFTSTGTLVAVQNRAGLQQTYQYNTSNQLTSVTDPFGRQLVFTYDSSGRIQTLTTPTGVFTYGYDANNNLASVQNPDSSTVQYLYENTSFPNALTGLIDENNNRYATWGYDSSGRANSSQHAGGVDSFSAVYTVNAAGQVTSTQATEPATVGQTALSRTLSFTTINFKTLPTNVTEPCTECGDKTASLTYDSNGFIASKTDFDGNVTQYVHDGFGNETSRTEAYGTQDARSITTQWNYALNQPTLITEPGRTTGYTYDGVGHVLTKTVTDTTTNVARTTTYTYNTSGAATGLLATVTDPLNHVTSYGYDNQGDLASVTNALNQVTQIAQYDANGMPLTIVDPNGVTTTLTYDARQRLKTRTVAGAETQFAYDPVGNLTQVTLPTGSYLKYSYDAAHRLTGIQDSACVSGVCDSIAYTLDNLGNRTKEQTYDPSNTLQKTLQRTYNSLNQLVTTVGGAGQTTTFTPDQNGNTTSIKDPLTNVTGQTFDALNRLATVVDPESGNTTYNYDPLDRVQDVTDPKGLDTHYSYDAFGDVVSQQSPDTGTTGYTYDLDGNRLTKTDARGITATYSYDALNRLTGIVYPDASRDVTYTYDQGAYGIGHLTGISDPTGTTTYSYDAHGNTIQKAVTLGGHTLTVGYQYDTADNLTGMTYPSGLQVSYVRDAAERVTAVNANNSPIVSGITYEPFGPITGFSYGNGLTETRSYDQDYRLTGITVPGVLNWTFQENADDDITAITDGITGSNSQTLGYDTLNRLTAATGVYGAQSYQYDLDGNRNQETLGGTQTTLGYDTASNKLLTVGSQSDVYDAVGNLKSDGTHSYNYDATNRLAGYDSTPTAYLYNGLGQRSVKAPVDSTTPTVAITAPMGGADLSGAVMVTASAVDVFEIASVQFKLDGGNLGSAVTSAPYSVSWDTSSASEGTHTLTAVATDPNNHTATAAGVSVIVDHTPPTVSLTAPANGADLRGTVTVSANATDNISVANVQFQLNGINLGPAQTSAPYGVSWDTTTATGGAHTLKAIATDAAGNTTSTTLNVTVDNAAPTVAITAPASGADLKGSATISATANASFGVGIASVQFQLDGANLGSAITTAPYTLTWDTTAASGGAHTLTAIATDAAGNNTTSATVTVTVDDVAPSVVITAPSTGADLKGAVTVSANAMASFGVNIASVQFKLDGVNLSTTQTMAPFGVSWDTTTTVGGGHILTAIATDGAGNTTTSAGVSVIVDNSPPTVSLTTPSSGADLRGTVTVSATAGASFGVAITSVQFQLDGANLGAAETSAPYSVAWDTTTATGGAHTLKIIATDGAGNTTTTASVSVTVDNTPPTVSITAPANGANVTGNVSITATASDNVAVTSVQFKLDGANLGAAETSAPYSLAWASYTALGSHTLTAIAADGAGNTNSASVTVTAVDTAAAANAGSFTTNAGAVYAGTLSTTLGYTGQTLTYAVVTAPTHGIVTITNTATGAFTYTPTAAYVGPDSFTFKATDEDNTVSNTATESITVFDVAAVANNGSVNTAPETAVSGTLGVTLGYTGQTLTFAVVTNPTHGSLSITSTATGAFTYTPTMGYTGSDTFTFKATDSHSTVSNTATETVTITGPVASLSPASYSFGSLAAGSAAGEPFTLTNSGNGPLTGISASLSGNTADFLIASGGTTCSSTLAAGW